MARKRKPVPKTSSSDEDDLEEQHPISNDPPKPQADDEDEDEEESEEDEDDDDDDEESESEEDQEEEENDDDDEEDRVEEEEEDFSTRDSIRKLLEPFGKEQLIELLKESALKNPSLIISQIPQSAESDPIHRKLFVFGLGWDATSQTLSSAFSQYGDIEECRLVTDRVTGRSKGYGFVHFKTRAATLKALKEPQKIIGGRPTTCKLASFGAPNGGSSNVTVPEHTGRKIFVGDVGPNVDPQRLRAFFAKFGEIEEGPLGYDRATGKLRGYAIFTYKTVEGCKKALEEPVKVFEGCALQCNRALEGLKPKTTEPRVSGVPVATVPGVLQPNYDLALAHGPGTTLMGMNPAVGLVGQNLNNPAVGGLVGQSLNPLGVVGLGATGFVGQNSSAAAAVGLMNPAVGLSSTVNRSSMTPTSYGIGSGVNSISPSVIGSYQGVNSISPSVIGSYQSQAALQGLGAYQNRQQSSGTHGMRSQPGSGLYGAGLPSYFGR